MSDINESEGLYEAYKDDPRILLIIDKQTSESLGRLLKYISAAEEKNYLDCPEHERERHIFHDWLSVAAWFDKNVWPELHRDDPMEAS
jgi:hypothetical protein